MGLTLRKSFRLTISIGSFRGKPVWGGWQGGYGGNGERLTNWMHPIRNTVTVSDIY